ncbi:putative transferase [Helianthus annuus]|uniref:Transferase n=1 Tax=Helianthus annuus TaxID=4232 RepID=A0A251UK52_HELAN|nr:putative transferase [Helianthus annuus]KAJ0574043.1 putative transferase [Helianthus annuus]KAJ0738378.1 putative transferase [Helianthus annuus]KAJ0741267.1 putative transferase [Helianthus annuus]KAJ0912487.1 putative transferase [Helianthus annuus]
MSLMNLLLACTRKVSDPEALPTLPGNNNKSGVAKVASIWSRLGVLRNSFVALLMFVLTALFLQDTKTPMKGSKGVEHWARRFIVRSTLNDVVLGVTHAGFYRYLRGRYSETDDKRADVPDNMRFRATFFFNLRAATRINVSMQPCMCPGGSFLTDFTDTDAFGTWGNKIGYSLLPFDIRFKKDPLDYVRDANSIVKQKKASLEPLFTYFFTKLFIMLFGIKAAGKLNHKVFYNTTLWFSNVPGPQEKITFFGHEVEYIAPSCYGQPNALMIHVVSYTDKVIFVISADEETIPDPHKLCDDLEESLRDIKASAHSQMVK